MISKNNASKQEGDTNQMPKKILGLEKCASEGNVILGLKNFK